MAVLFRFEPMLLVMLWVRVQTVIKGLCEFVLIYPLHVKCLRGLRPVFRGFELDVPLRLLTFVTCVVGGSPVYANPE